MNPNFPLYIVSKGRAKTRLTSKALERMGVPYHIVVEEQEFDEYAAVIDPSKVLVLDKRYQVEYPTLDDEGDALGKGPGAGAARNFVWDHSIAQGAKWHWVMDDNIRDFYRLNNNQKVRVYDGAFFLCLEDFVQRYKNVAMAGPSYELLTKRKHRHPPMIMNTRIYSCNLIRNDVPYRWRGRYNEDTDLSLRMLKDGWCTIQFTAFLQDKCATQTVRGGCDTEFYQKEGTMPKSKMLVEMHPDVTELVWKFHRWHHKVDYRPFQGNLLIRRDDIEIPSAANEYGMVLVNMKEI